MIILFSFVRSSSSSSSFSAVDRIEEKKFVKPHFLPLKP